MHNYGENKATIKGRLINDRFTGNLQHRFGCMKIENFENWSESPDTSIQPQMTIFNSG